MATLVIGLGKPGGGKLSDKIVEEMKRKRGKVTKPAAADDEEYSEAEEGAEEGADEKAAMQEFMDALDAGDADEALKTFKALMASCSE